MLAQQIQILDDMFKELEKNVKDAYDISCKLKVQTYLICYIDYAYKSVQKCKQVITDLKRSFENRSELLKYSSIESVVKNEEMINTGSKFKEDNYNVDKEIGDNLEFELKIEDILKYSELNESTNDYTITEETKVSGNIFNE